MPRKKQTDYYDKLRVQCSAAQNAAKTLEDALRNYDFLKLPTHIETMQGYLKESAQIRKTLTQALIEDFLPPLDRGDLMEITCGLDSLIRHAEHTLQHVFALQVPRILPAAVELAAKYSRQADCLAEVIGMLDKLKKNSAEMLERTIQIDQIEDECDTIYVLALQEVFSQQVNPRELLVWRMILHYLEQCSDEGNALGRSLEATIMKNI
ncbi:MAG: DUF47 family protein [Oscillospiraceae bacterium]|nr:DUF47 family protein [Oscillospiraceae bacterium]